MSPALDSAFVKEAARLEGFCAAGVARARPLDPGPLARVLASGWDADMAWLGRSARERLDPSLLLPGVRSVVALALSYSAREAPEPARGRVARYARGRDYHAVTKRRLAALVRRLRERAPDLGARASCDVSPVMEKAWAQEAGIGWVGKNGCLITERHGSWVLLATLLLDRDLDPDPPHPDRCGSCRACLPACPTGAIPVPGFVDARRCISYWTIERRGSVPDEVAEKLGPWVFGCDDCQTACPWNQGTPADGHPELAPRPARAALDLDATLRLSEEDYRKAFFGTALARARRDGLLRNAAIASGLEGDPRRSAALRALLGSPFPGVAAAARWALARLEGAPRVEAATARR